ncbi:MAG: acyl-CoA dehydrogenase C-terminal domain-containing protein [Pseudomonadota bacterium]
MPTYKAPVRDTQFVLDEMLNITQYAALPGFADATPDIVNAVLEEGGKYVEEITHPLNQSGDEIGCTRNDDGSVTTPPGFKSAYEQLVAGGWVGLGCDPAYGGQGLPHVVATSFEEYMISGNMAFTMYMGLTTGAIAAIQAVATEEQKQTYIPKMVEGRWSGTMNLTEPHCGTDLGLLTTKAEPQSDGSYRISGTKIFISSGEHDLTENIIHLVLAKIPGSPDSVRGISLFIVPKFILDENGEAGEKNGVSCGSIEKKMGIHGNATCVMNYDAATGYLIGEPDKGLRAMFIMMNAARLGVGMQGLSISELAYQNAAAYAQDRQQGRSLSGPKNSAGKADPIIVHADVRRMLLNIKAFNEGARALALWTALHVDLSHKAPTPEERQQADDVVGLMTPVIKAYFTDQGYENATNAQQCLGGHGYIREWGLEQCVRDARIAMIYEGTNGIQALDLVGRKLSLNGGRAYKQYVAIITQFIKEIESDSMQLYSTGLEAALADLNAATQWLAQNGVTNPDNAGAGAVPYLRLFALVAMGFTWASIAKTCLSIGDAGKHGEDFYRNKITTAEYFFSHLLIETGTLKQRVMAGADNIMALDGNAFQAAG